MFGDPEETTTESAFDEGDDDTPTEETVADQEPATEDAFDTSTDATDGYEEDENTGDGYEEDDDSDEAIDLGDVPDEPPPPESGWHKVKVGYYSGKPSKAGDKKKAFVLNFQNGYSHWAHFTIGSPTGGEFAQRELKVFARACGVGDLPDQEGTLAPFTPSDLLDSYLYVRVNFKEGEDFPVEIAAYSPETEVPNEDLVSDQSNDDDGLPF